LVFTRVFRAIDGALNFRIPERRKKRSAGQTQPRKQKRPWKGVWVGHVYNGQWRKLDHIDRAAGRLASHVDTRTGTQIWPQLNGDPTRVSPNLAGQYATKLVAFSFGVEQDDSEISAATAAFDYEPLVIIDLSDSKLMRHVAKDVERLRCVWPIPRVQCGDVYDIGLGLWFGQNNW
jgi:hypothetical protein